MNGSVCTDYTVVLSRASRSSQHSASMKSTTLAWAAVAAVWTLCSTAPITPEFLLGGLVVGNAALIACVVSDCHGRSRGGGGFRGPPRGFRGPSRGFRGPSRGFRGPSRGFGGPRGGFGRRRF